MTASDVWDVPRRRPISSPFSGGSSCYADDWHFLLPPPDWFSLLRFSRPWQQAVPGEQSPEQRSSQPTDSNTPVANGTRVSSPALAFLGRIDLNRPLSRKPAAGIDSYVEGLDALANGQFVQAVSHLSRAVEANDEAAAYYTARGVAYMLLEKLEEAQADLRKSLLLRPGDQETQAWVGAAQRMTGDMRAIRSFLGSSNPFEQALGTISVEYGKGRNTGPAGNSRPGEAPRMIAAARAKFPWLGSLFAERRKSAPELTPFLYALARSQYARHEYAAALAQLERVLSLRPGDLAVLYYHAACLVELGDNAKAREELTRVLIGQTDFADAYLRRALACARLGATRRTTADLETAKRLAPRISIATQRASTGKSTLSNPTLAARRQWRRRPSLRRWNRPCGRGNRGRRSSARRWPSTRR